MEKRKLGQGLVVSALSLGAMGYGKSRDIPDRPEMIALLRKAVDLGMDFFDTAEVYGPWTNEEMVGEAFRGMRDKVKIATKFGWDIDQNTGEHRGGVNSKPTQIRSAVGKGFLTVTIDASTKFSDADMRRTVPRFAIEARNANQRLVDLLRAVGARQKASAAQVALAWLLARKPWIVPLFGTRKLERFEENIGSLSVRLSADEMNELNASRATMPVKGHRYPEERMRRVGL